MSRQVALLRGINVGGHNKLPMAPLRDALTELGYRDVRTHLQSGNVVFDTGARPKRVEEQVSQLIADRFGLAVPVVVRTLDQMASVVADNPLPDAAGEPARFLVIFLSTVPDPAVVDALDPAAVAADVYRLRGREIYLYCPDGIRNSALAVFPWGKRLGLTATARNWNTVTRLLALLSE